MDRLSNMLGSENSYVCIRGLTLIAYNVKWDKDYKIDEIIDNYIKHITDMKPIIVRQCIKLLPIIAKDKPELRNDILFALHKANSQTVPKVRTDKYLLLLHLQTLKI